MKKIVFQMINIAEAVVGVFALIYYFVCLFSGTSGRSILYVWLIGGGALVMKSAFVLFLLKTGRLKRGIRICANCFSVVFFVWSAGVLTFSAVSVSEMNKPQAEGLDCILILGARVNGNGTPSDALNSRIETAFAYLGNHPQTIALAAGGQGKGEGLAEGECIKQELVKKGIPSERILVENRSATTVENMKFSNALIPKDVKTVGIVTNNFHVLRSVITAGCYIDKEISGVSAPFSGILLPHYMLREFITFLVELFRGNLF